MLKTYLFASLLLACGLPASAQNPPGSCGANAGVPPLVRSDGITELVGDVILNCAGLTTGPSQGFINVAVSFNTTVTSKTVAGASEALLLIGEPDANSQVLGTNVFQASVFGVNKLLFNHIPITQQGPNGQTTMRLTNLRVNASQIGLSTGQIPSQILASITVTGLLGPVLNDLQVVGFIQPGMSSAVLSPADTHAGLAFPQCTGQNTGLRQSTSATGGAVSFNVKFSEGYASAFRTRVSTLVSMGNPPQSFPGYPYSTESGFYNLSLPVIGGADGAGLATQGTRLMARFANVPVGVSVYVTTAPVASTGGSPPPGYLPLDARLISTDANGAGPYTPVIATSTVIGNGQTIGIAPITLVNGSGTAVWEVVSASPFNLESISFGTLLAYTSGDPTALGTATITRTFAPLSTDTTMSSAIVPRFIDNPVANTFQVYSCGAPVPDIAVTTFGAPATASLGSKVPVTSTITNRGGSDAGPFRVSISVYADQNLITHASRFQFLYCAYAGLAAGSTASCNGDLMLPWDINQGNYYYGIIADDQNKLIESNGTNNTAFSPLNATAPCVFSIFPSSLSIGATGGFQSAAITSTGPVNCPWTAQTAAGWISITSNGPGTSGGQGSGTFSFTVSPNTGSTRNADITVGEGTGFPAILNVTQAQAVNQTPAAVTLAPVASSGASQSFTFQFSDPDGYQDLGVLNVLVNSALDGRHACYIAYSRPANVLYLVNDVGDGLLPGLTLNGSGAVGNSQCTVTGSGSSASGSGNTLTLTLNLSFSPAFGGNKLLFLAARDSIGNNSGWQTLGVHGVPALSPTFPAAIGMNPSSGVIGNAVLTYTYRDQTDANNLQTAWALINSALDGAGACYTAYYRPANLLLLLPDNGNGAQATSMVLNGGNASLSNSQCTIFGSGSSASVNGNQLTVTLNTVFKPAFAGRKGIWLGVATLTGQSSDWQALGAWQVPGN